MMRFFGSDTKDIIINPKITNIEKKLQVLH